MSYVLNGVEAPTLDALELALARRSQASLGAVPSLAARAQSMLQGLVKTRRSAVRKVLKKFGSLPRGIPPRTSATVKAPWGKSYDFSSTFVNKANDGELAGLLLVAAAVDRIHLANAAVQAALSGLGEDAADSGIDPATVTAVVDIVVKLGPQLMTMVDSLMKGFAPAPAKPAAPAAAPAAASAAIVPMSVSPALPAEKKSNMPLILGLGVVAAVGVWFFFLRKK